jgi:hypothetical protein
MQTHEVARIVAIEPDRECGRALRRRVREWAGAEVFVVDSAAAALSAVAEMAPDLILISATAPPADDAHFTACLHALPAGRHLQILSVPPLVDEAMLAPATDRGPLQIFGRRPVHPWPAYDADALGARVREAVRQARDSRGERRQLAAELVASGVRVGGPAEGHVPLPVAVQELTFEELLARCGMGAQHPRAHRWTGDDVPWLSHVTWPWGVDVRLLNISSSGMLIESDATLSVGHTTEFQLRAGGAPRLVSARVVRSVDAGVTANRRTYRTAAVFEQALVPLAPRPMPWRAPHTPPAPLAALLTWVQDESRRGVPAERLRLWFELGVQQAVGAREVYVSAAPVRLEQAGDTVFFDLPSDEGGDMILQATFEPDRGPSAQALEMLRAAATMATSVLALERVRTPAARRVS